MIVRANAAAIPLRDESVHMVVTSPPFWGLRAYQTPPQIWDGDPTCEHLWGATEPGSNRGGSSTYNGRNGAGEGYARAESRGNFCSRCGAWRGELGLEPTLDLFVAHMGAICREIRRVLRADGSFWLNLGDSYAGGGHGHRDPERWPKQSRNDHHPIHAKKYPSEGLKFKDLCMVPARVVLALQAEGWYVRSRITICKNNGMPESVSDRPVSATEDLYLLSKGAFYYYDPLAVREAAAASSIARISQPTFNSQQGGPKDYARNPAGRNPADLNGHNRSSRKALENFALNPGRNLRNWWVLSSEPMTETAYDFEAADFLDSYGLPHTRADECPVHGRSDNTDDTPCGWCPLSVTSHFATFPSDIPRKAILAGTSEKGVCDRCGAPLVRVIERGKLMSIDGTKLSYRPKKATDDAHIKGRSDGWTPQHYYPIETLGWKPTCKCDAGVAPAIVFDPFFGSGTTGEIAEELGRRWIGADLSWTYASQIAPVRTAQMGLRFAT